MANFWKVNQTSADGAVRVWDLIETMLAAGWTMPNASDGTTMAVNRVTGPGSGDYGLGNTRAWVRLQDPGGLTEYTIQRTTSNPVYRIKRSVSAKFTGGSPDETTTPTAADETIVKGAGTDASPTGASMFAANNNRHHCMAENTGYYDFYMISYPVGGGACNGIFMQDTVESFGGVLDTDPIVIIVGDGVNNNTMSQNAAVNVGSVGVYGYLGATFTPMRAQSIVSPNANTSFYSSQIGVNPYTSKDDFVPIFPGRVAADAAPNGVKGKTTKFLVGSVQRASGDTLSEISARDRIVIMGTWTISLPWNGDVPSV
jgi:hypothetical protein